MRSGSLSPSASLLSSSPVPESESLDLSALPSVYVISTYISEEELHDIEDALIRCHAPLTYDTSEARLFLCNLNTAKRIQFELRKSRVWTKETSHVSTLSSTLLKVSSAQQEGKQPHENSRKKRKLRSSYVSSSSPEPSPGIENRFRNPENDISTSLASTDETLILVVKIQWLKDVVAQGRIISLSDYLLYEGRRIEKPSDLTLDAAGRTRSSEPPEIQEQPDDILKRAKADPPPASKGPRSRFVSAPHGSRRFRDQQHRSRWGDHEEKTELLQVETSSQDTSPDNEIPSPPEWVTQNLKYACQRITPTLSPNEEFLDLLKKIRLARLLTSDEIGVRAYSTSIAAIAAVPTKIFNPKEILRLPGCDVKIANLWIEYRNTDHIAAASEVDTDDTLVILNKFYQIWGVGDKTARDFFNRGWRDLDDIVEYGWDQLTRVQQIGVKYYDEFQVGIPRAEVEFILEKVREHAVKVRDDGIEALVVGGYRRGKTESGDVDIIVSHRELAKTANLVTDIVASLEEEGWVTHTLRLDLTNTHRDQSTLPLKGSPVAIGSGFDTLDKAMVVWQDINWPNKEEILERDPKAKNPNIHRRVDIIVSAWRTVGCSVLGWSGGK
jgi:DNA polymerase IV